MLESDLHFLANFYVMKSGRTVEERFVVLIFTFQSKIQRSIYGRNNIGVHCNTKDTTHPVNKTNYQNRVRRINEYASMSTGCPQKEWELWLLRKVEHRHSPGGNCRRKGTASSVMRWIPYASCLAYPLAPLVSLSIKIQKKSSS